jgi:hypothetical protein
LATEASAKAFTKAIDYAITKVTAKAWAKEPNAQKTFANTFQYLTTEAGAKALAKTMDNAIAKVTATAWAKELNAPCSILKCLKQL